MKNSIYIKSFKLLCIAAVSTFLSCSTDDTCEYTQVDTEVPCTPFQENTERAGWTIATNYNSNDMLPNGVIYDTRFNSNAPLGDDWGVALNTPSETIHPSNWTGRDIGNIFGTAIDKDENIYLGASGIYDTTVFPTPTANAVPGRVYKCSPPTYTAVPFFDLTNTGGTENGTGNIAYDKLNDQLFVSNLEDGKIYRYDMAGSYLGEYDPWTADTGSAGIVALDEQVWGIGVNYEGGVAKVYFARITINNITREMYSVALDGTGSFPVSGSESLEFSNIPGNQLKLSDISFSSNKQEMLIAERGDPHQAKVLSYTKSGASWSFNQQYFVGGFSGENSSGGVDFAYKEIEENVSAECDQFFWASGNYMQARNLPIPGSDRVYGLQGIAYTGNNDVADPIGTANQDTDIFIDLNGVYTWEVKGSIGDVEVFDADDCFDLCDF